MKSSLVVMFALALTACPGGGDGTGTSADTSDSDDSDSNTNGSTVSVTLGTTMSGSETTDGTTTVSTTVEPTGESTAPTTETTMDPDSGSSGGSETTTEGTSGEESSSTGDDGGATIYDIQQEVIAEGTDVQVFGVVVTAVGFDRFWAQEPAGGEYSGIVVYAGDQFDALGVGDLAIGDVVDIAGTVDEFADLTEIDIEGANGTLAVVASGDPLEPELVELSVFGAAITAEPWESTLVRIEGTPLTVTADPNMFDEFPVSDGTDEIMIDDFVYNAVESGDFAGLATGASFDAIQGPVNWFNNTWKIMPRAAGDLEGYAAP